MTLLSGTFSDSSVHPQWTVTIQAPTASPFNGSMEYVEAGTSAWANQTEGALTSDGFTPRADTLYWPNYVGDPRGVLGVRVRVGEFAAYGAAQADATQLASEGFSPLVEWEGSDPQQPPEVELLHGVIVDPRHFTGRVIAYHGTAVAGRQTVAAQAQVLGSLAAVNGGFFSIGSNAAGGTPTGLGVYDGKLEALANDSRAALEIESPDHARILNLSSTALLSASGSSVSILGINRQPGYAEDCGVPGFSPTSAPRQGYNCTGSTDVVLFTPQFGAPLPSGQGMQAIIDPTGRVTALGNCGGNLPAGDSAVQALGADASWLAAHATIGTQLTITEHLGSAVTSSHGNFGTVSVVSAAPVLLHNGRVAIDAVHEGVFDPRDLYDYGFSAERHARTMAGVDAEGRLLLVTADGIPGVSEGLTLTEEAELMHLLGAINAMNLDGGGSTSFVMNGQTINEPSDGAPRAVGDSLQVLR